MTPDENQLLTRVEGDAPMGAMLRENYWIPAVRSQKLEADGAPARIRLFGRNYVAFRATDGRVGFLNEACPHRRVSLALARNEDCALRCIFHGWKISVTGELLEAPNQHSNPEAFIKKPVIHHYPVVEAGRLVWVWLGSGKPAPFPAFEFTGLPPEQVVVLATTQNFNWLQGVEAAIDSSHVGMLHQSWLSGLGDTAMTGADNAPSFEFEPTSYGYRAAALRSLGDGRRYSRVSEYVFPWCGLIPPNRDDGNRLAVFSVPVDDVTSTNYYIRFNLRRAVDPNIYMPFADFNEFSPLPGGPENAWGQNRTAMKLGNFTGFHSLFHEDFAVQASMGAITDRSEEFLSDGDLAVVRARRLLLQAVRDWQAGKPPMGAGAADIDYRHIRSRAEVIAAGEDWRATAAVPAE